MKVILRGMLMAILLLVSLPSLAREQVWQGPGLYTVAVQDVYVRTHPMGLVRGSLYKGQSFYAFTQRKGWMWGFAYGNCNKPGWAPVGSDGNPDFVFAPKSSQRSAPKNMMSTPHYLNRGIDYVTAKERKEKHIPFSKFAKVTSETLTLYGNYSPKTGPADPILVLKKGTSIGIRYVFSGTWVITQLKSVDSPDKKPHWAFADSKFIGKLPSEKPQTAAVETPENGSEEPAFNDFEDEPTISDERSGDANGSESALPESDETLDGKRIVKDGQDGTIQGGSDLPDAGTPNDFGAPEPQTP